MRILFLTNLLPYPMDNGGKIKTYTTLKAFNEAGFSVDLFCFKEKLESMKKEEKELLKICDSVNQVYLPLTTSNYKNYMKKIALKSLFSHLPFSIYKYFSKDMIKMLDNVKNEEYDLIYFDHLQMCVYYDYINLNWPVAKKILDEHNCESIITKRKLNDSKNLLKKLFLSIESFKLEAFERKTILKVDKTIVLSTIDYEALLRITRNDFIHSIIPIGVEDRGVKKNNESNKLTILFVGTLTWEPNNKGLIWFLKDVLPIIEKHQIDYHLYIVGKNPSDEVINLSKKYAENITITGYVDTVDEYYDKCQCTIVPLFIGSGQRVKLIEAFSKGMPAISTTIGAEGLFYEPEESILIADDKEMFANAIISINNIETRNKIGANCRKIYDKYYSQKVISKQIIESIESEKD